MKVLLPFLSSWALLCLLQEQLCIMVVAGTLQQFPAASQGLVQGQHLTGAQKLFIKKKQKKGERTKRNRHRACVKLRGQAFVQRSAGCLMQRTKPCASTLEGSGVRCVLWCRNIRTLVSSSTRLPQIQTHSKEGYFVAHTHSLPQLTHRGTEFLSYPIKRSPAFPMEALAQPCSLPKAVWLG